MCKAATDNGHCPPVCEYYRRSHAAGWDAGNNNMRANKRTEWNREDYDASCRVFNDAFGALCPIHPETGIAIHDRAYKQYLRDFPASDPRD